MAQQPMSDSVELEGVEETLVLLDILTAGKWPTVF